MPRLSARSRQARSVSVTGFAEGDHVAAEAAEEYAVIRLQLERGGQPIGERDLLIAATAKARRLTVVTHNVREAVRLGDRVVVLSSRPGRVIAEYDVPIQHPRRIDSAPVAELAAQITDRLREEMGRDAS